MEAINLLVRFAFNNLSNEHQVDLSMQKVESSINLKNLPVRNMLTFADIAIQAKLKSVLILLSLNLKLFRIFYVSRVKKVTEDDIAFTNVCRLYKFIARKLNAYNYY